MEEYKKRILNFSPTPLDLKLTDKKSGKTYMGIDVFKRYVNSENKHLECFCVSEPIMKHDRDGVMMYRGDIIVGRIDNFSMPGIIDYDTNDCQYKIFWENGLVSVFGQDTDEFTLIEVVGHASVMNNEYLRVEVEFYEKKI